MILKIMEKRKPHYVLSKLKALFTYRKTRIITKKAHKGAAAMGYMDDDDITSVISSLCSEHFIKSMTTYQSNKIWQDVYRCQDGEKSLYIKLQLSDNGETILIQMKKDEGRDE